jgi:nitric oxide synthase oxygenase domain/subunit
MRLVDAAYKSAYMSTLIGLRSLIDDDINDLLSKIIFPINASCIIKNGL